MRYRELGRTGIRVSLMGLGAVKFGRTEGLKYPSPSTLPTMRALADLLAAAHDLGVNLIDTAPAYGSSEERLGQLLAGRRNDWVLCTKVGETFDGTRSHYDFSPEQTRRSVLRSLQRLATDRLDVVLVHSDGNDVAIIDERGTLEALAQMKQEGLIRAFGMSHKTVAGGLRAVDVCDAVMTTLNVEDRETLAVVEHAHARGCGVLIKKALASGAVAHDPARRRASLQFLAATRGVSSIVVGTTDVIHLRENVTALEHLPDTL